MGELFTVGNLITLLMLVLLQAVLGFDNLLYISLESKRVPADQQSFVRRLGIGLAMILRIVLLVILLQAISLFQEPFFQANIKGLVEGNFTIHSVIVLVGGIFIIYTAIKEVFHMLSINHFDEDIGGSRRTVANAVSWIVAMNLVFSFDSILSAIALTDQVVIMATAIVIGGLLMIWLADHVAEFLDRNRMYEVLGLFILFIVGIMLLSEGAHLAKLHLFGHEIEAMAKSTFYFVIVILILVDVVQGRYQKQLLAKRASQQLAHK